MRLRVWWLAAAVAACGGNSSPPAGDGGVRDAAGDAPSDVDASAPRPRLVYLSANDDSNLAVAILEADGSLTRRADLDLALPGNPGAVAYARESRRLYVGLQQGNIATVELDGDGAPSLQAMTTDGTGNPVYVSVTAGESVMVTAYFGADEIKTHDVSGVAPHAENATFAVADEPHAALPGPGGRIYVPHRSGDLIRWFTIDGAGDPVFAGELAAEPGVGPRHIAFSPDGAFAYVVNEFGNSVSAHTVGGDGSLSRFETVPGIADPVAGTDTGADIHVTPDGRFVYASFRGRDVLAMFSIGSDGALASLGTAATEARPREFDVSPDGRFVIACGQDSGFIQSYRVEASGVLSPIDRLQIGGDLRWAIID